jgi:hypothetical protein
MERNLGPAGALLFSETWGVTLGTVKHTFPVCAARGFTRQKR